MLSISAAVRSIGAIPDGELLNAGELSPAPEQTLGVEESRDVT
jgi:hypothetical protein